MLAVTLGLGFWQLQRLAWKTGLLSAIAAAEAGLPVSLPPTPEPFRRVRASGRFLPIVARYGAEVRSSGAGPVMGAHLLSPMEMPGRDPVLVDRGWAPLDFDPTPPTGPVAVEGYVRPAEHASFASIGDDVVARRFYTLDPVRIGAALGLPAVSPFTLVALGGPGRLPEPAATLPRPPNDHLSYALTWFGLSAALVGVFGLYVRQSFAQARNDVRL